MSEKSFKNSEGSVIVYELIKAIQDNKGFLSEIDGAIGDGDHGINMNKGFTLCKQRLGDSKPGFASALKTLGRILLMEIGGSMGPLYGQFFIEMSKVMNDVENIDQQIFGSMLKAAAAGVEKLGGAKVGDKTMMDALAPAIEAFDSAVLQGANFAKALTEMKEASIKGRDATRDMVARLGRASRLGERSRGVLDAGATSCSLILGSMADSIITIISS